MYSNLKHSNMKSTANTVTAQVGDKVKVSAAYGGQNGIVTEIPSSGFLTVEITKGSGKGNCLYFHESDVKVIVTREPKAPKRNF